MTLSLNRIVALYIALLLVTTQTLAANGDRTIRLLGNVNPDVDKRLSVKQLESYFHLYSDNIYNPWEKASFDYSGIWIKELVTTLGGKDVSKVTFKAIDDYQVEMTKPLWNQYRILLVTQQNGGYIPVSKKGPMRLAFPDYDANNKEYEQNLVLWAWMITQIEFE